MMRDSLKLKLRQSLVLALIWIMTLCFGIACSKTNQDPSILKIRLNAEPVSLDPTRAEDGASLMILNNTMDGLMGYDEKGQLEKRIAENIQVSAQGLEYRFTLKKNALWSDGQPILAQHFITAFKRARDPQNLSKLGVFFQIISSVTEDQGVLCVKLKEKTPYFLELLTLPPAFPQRQEILSAHQGRWPENAPVTGAYRIVSHDVDQRIRLQRNPLYSGQQGVIEQVNFLIVSDESTAIHLFESAQLDVIYRIQSMDLPRLRKKGWIHSDPFLSTYYLAFNCKKTPFQDAKWRQAVAGVIQRKEITTLLGTEDLPAWSWIPKGLEGYESYQDPREVFASSISQIQKSPQFNMVLEAGFDHQDKNFRVMEKVQNDLKTALGIQLQLTHLDWKSYIQRLQVQAPAIYRFGFQAPFLDPIMHLKVFTSGSLYNFTGCSSPEYDRIVSEIEKLESGPLRKKKIHEAQKILLEKEAMVIPLYHYTSHSVVAPRVRGFQLNPLGMLLIKKLRLEESSSDSSQ